MGTSLKCDCTTCEENHDREADFKIKRDGIIMYVCGDCYFPEDIELANFFDIAQAVGELINSRLSLIQKRNV